MNTYVEKNPMTIQATKFTGEITEDLSQLGFIAPNSFQVNVRCPNCGQSLANHALRGVGNSFQPLCPNTYIIIDNQGSFQTMSAQNFESLYRLKWKDIEDVTFEEVKGEE